MFVKANPAVGNNPSVNGQMSGITKVVIQSRVKCIKMLSAVT